MYVCTYVRMCVCVRVCVSRRKLVSIAADGASVNFGAQSGVIALAGADVDGVRNVFDCFCHVGSAVLVIWSEQLFAFYVCFPRESLLVILIHPVRSH
jgi:hypothetical protein